MSLAAETRRAVAKHPFLVSALRASVVNYTAAARFLDVEGDVDAIATALRRYAAELPDYDREPRDVRVRMERGVDELEPADRDDVSLAVGNGVFGAGSGEFTEIVATGTVDGRALAAVLERLAVDDVDVVAAGVAADTLVVVVERLEGASALRGVEDALDGVPVEPSAQQI
ncbi:DUF7523 family protein [Natrarchaeobaculum sulfurireducens]|uniref:Uncharacterized protein n=1 Tax=Natrarchaeobaculum sulfurireducens TaxID=2044521 RepID=A0A346PQX0_9EURY|nr:hypothetical protein [Natrarchaeobaculum sulfurireducens]AXR78096.1 hypothetical protein AArc1_1772 [Natrarchaeobaculum sulfurireducens]AXR81915.1 hypothetical protein AArcMg_1908 [Natrarchaeobaculum sulfurireducens]